MPTLKRPRCFALIVPFDSLDDTQSEFRTRAHPDPIALQPNRRRRAPCDRGIYLVRFSAQRFSGRRFKQGRSWKLVVSNLGELSICG